MSSGNELIDKGHEGRIPVGTGSWWLSFFATPFERDSFESLRTVTNN
ncbi:MAG: hypothetical protein JW738_09340 [Actinobacteria bacterium]|nr:hypothetical protein [Actinomycetota bacterium]